MELNIRHAGRSDPGRHREVNEDRWVIEQALGMYLVSDGMGGEAAGALASQLVTEGLPTMLEERLDDQTPTLADLHDHLVEVICELSHQVYEKTQQDMSLRGMGATLVVAMVRDSQALIAHLGDSRAYLFRAGSLQILTRDHSVVQMLIDEGDIAPEDAGKHPFRGKITQCVGMGEEPEPEAHVLDLRDGDRLLLCSDGLSNMISEQEIARLLSHHDSAEEACERLVAAANEAGGRDNITVVLADLVAAE